MADKMFYGDLMSAFDFIKAIMNTDGNYSDDDKDNVDKDVDIHLFGIDTVLYPHILLSMQVFSSKDVKVLRQCYEENKKVGLVLKRSDGSFSNVGTLTSIIKIVNNEGGEGVQVLFHGDRRIRINNTFENEGFLVANVHIMRDEDVDENAPSNIATVQLLRDLTLQLVNSHPALSTDIKNFLVNNKNISLLTYLLASGLDIPLEQKQDILEALDYIARSKILIGFLKREIEVIEIKKQLAEEAQAHFTQKQKDSIIREQINILRSKLGGPNATAEALEDDEIDKLRKKAKKKKFSKEAKAFFEGILRKAERMQNISSDYMVLINQAEFILSLPWLSYNKEPIDITKAKRILEANHYGMEKVKERIIEYLAILKLNEGKKDSSNNSDAAANDGKDTKNKNKCSNCGGVTGQILCLLGPYGVGKTSLCRDIAKALGRDYVKISLGGISDEAVIRGHVKTYVGAMAGRIMRAMQHLENSNPVILLDEIDKLDSRHGDPSAALLEVLDPNQNNSFVDNYLEVPYDLSQVIFIATANKLSTIAKPLRDRLEIIDVEGYSLEEKIEIANRYIVPAIIQEHGLKDDDISFDSSVLETIIGRYTYESGVRELRRQISTIVRKICLKKVQGVKYTHKITNKDLHKYLGCEKYDLDIAERIKIPGVAIGLAWTENGGDILFIESRLIPAGSGKLTLSGSLGDVMKESAQLAFIYLKSHCKDFGIAEDMFKKNDFHIHVPDGATPKEGPSAGITLFTALFSLCTGRKLKDNIAMTGEISLRGAVLPVGGIKEKVLAAKRAGITKIIMSEKNKNNVAEIKKQYIKGVDFVFVKDINDVIKNVLSPEKK